MRLEREIDRLLDRWLERIPEASTAHRHDSTYHAQFTFICRTSVTLEMVMEDEGIPEHVRLRIIRTLIYGAPDETEALARMDGHAAQVERLETMPGRVVVPQELLRESKGGR